MRFNIYQKADKCFDNNITLSLKDFRNGLVQLEVNQSQNNQLIEVLLFQYRECWSDIQHTNNLVWQIPSVTTIIAGVLASLSSTAILPVRIVLFIIAFSLTFVMTIALHKNQFIMIYRLRKMKEIEDALGKLGIPLIAKGTDRTETIKKEIANEVVTNMPKGWFYNRTAYDWIRAYMFLLLIALVVGFIVTTLKITVSSYSILFSVS